MITSNNGLDERQRQRRDREGHFMFILMFCTLLIDSILAGNGNKWLPYPSRVIVIISVCMITYLLRTMLAGAFIPPSAKVWRYGITLAIFTAAMLICIGYYLQNPESSIAPALRIGIIACLAGLMVSLITTILAVKDIKRADEPEAE